MLKKISPIVLIFIIAFSGCTKDEFRHIPASERPKYKQGDTLIYAREPGNKDTLVVTKMYYMTIHTQDPVTFESIFFEVNKIKQSTIDTPDLERFYFNENTEYYHTKLFRLNRIDHDYLILDDYRADTVYKQISIGNRAYTSVYYYSLNTSATRWSNLYYSYQYGVLSVELNGKLIYLSETRPQR